MDSSSDYKIKSVEISTNGVNELYLDVEWEGDEHIEYYEIRVLNKYNECI